MQSRKTTPFVKANEEYYSYSFAHFLECGWSNSRLNAPASRMSCAVRQCHEIRLPACHFGRSLICAHRHPSPPHHQTQNTHTNGAIQQRITPPNTLHPYIHISPTPKQPFHWANSFPEVTNPFCRLPSPTFFYLTRDFSSWRPDAVSGTAGRVESFSTFHFHGSTTSFNKLNSLAAVRHSIQLSIWYDHSFPISNYFSIWHHSVVFAIVLMSVSWHGFTFLGLIEKRILQL